MNATSGVHRTSMDYRTQPETRTPDPRGFLMYIETSAPVHKPRTLPPLAHTDVFVYLYISIHEVGQSVQASASALHECFRSNPFETYLESPIRGLSTSSPILGSTPQASAIYFAEIELTCLREKIAPKLATVLSSLLSFLSAVFSDRNSRPSKQ